MEQINSQTWAQCLPLGLSCIWIRLVLHLSALQRYHQPKEIAYSQSIVRRNCLEL